MKKQSFIAGIAFASLLFPVIASADLVGSGLTSDVGAKVDVSVGVDAGKDNGTEKNTEADSSADKNSDGAALSTGVAGDVSVSTRPLPRTSGALSLAVDDIAQATLDNKGDTPESFCAALHTAFQAEAEDGRVSLAWAPQSYSSVVADDGAGLSGAQASLYTKTKTAITDTTTALEEVTTGGDQQRAIEFKVAIRSALLQFGSEFKKADGPDAERLNTISSFLTGAVGCLGSVADEASAANFGKIKETVAGVTSLWDSNKSIFTHDAEAVVSDDFSISAGDADGGDITVEDASKVTTANDLQLFAKTIAAKYPEVKTIASVSGNLIVKYKAPAKFIGIFKAGLSRKVTYNTDGTLSFSWPWYSFLYSKTAVDVSPIGEKVTAATKGLVAATDTGANATVSYVARAKALETMTTELFTVDTTTTTDTSTSTEGEVAPPATSDTTETL